MILGQLLGLAVLFLVEAAIASAPLCVNKQADVYFIVDTSDAVWRPDYVRQLSFVRDVVDRFHMGAARTRVGVIALSDRPRLAVPLTTGRIKLNGLKRAILRVRQDSGAASRASLSDAFRFLRDSCTDAFRGDVSRMAILLTSGSWRRDDKSLVMEAKLTQEDEGVQVLAVGIGSQVHNGELALASSKPSAYYTFPVATFADLKDIRELLAVKACSVMEHSAEETSDGDHSLAVRKPYILEKPKTPDVIAHEPSEQNYAGARFGTLESFGREGAMEKHSSNDIPRELMGERGYVGMERQLRQPMRVRRPILVQQPPRIQKPVRIQQPIRVQLPIMVQRPINVQKPIAPRSSRGCVPKVALDIVFVVSATGTNRKQKRQLWRFVRKTLSGIDRGEGRVRARFLHAGMHVPGTSDNHTASPPDLLRLMTQRLREGTDVTAEGDPVWPVGVYITDGRSGDLEGTLREAQAARIDHGIELFSVAVGDGVSLTEMRAIPSCPMDKHFLAAESHQRLSRFTRRLTKRLCFGKRRR